MPRICPHCRFPFDPDWGDDAVPAACPRCGGQLRAAQANPEPIGIATFLRVPVPDEASVTSRAGIDTDNRGVEIAAAASIEAATPVPAAEPLSTPAAATPPAAAPAAAVAAPSPSFTRRTVEPAASPRTALWQWIALGLLLLALPLQLLLADRARLAADAGWRPLLASLCGALRCELPPWREPQAFTMIERDVRPIPGSPGELQVRATFRNDARWAQPWPRLQLSLADADGRTVGARGFEPREYLGHAPADLLRSGQSAQIAFRIREPATPAAAFQFEFR